MSVSRSVLPRLALACAALLPLAAGAFEYTEPLNLARLPVEVQGALDDNRPVDLIVEFWPDADMAGITTALAGADGLVFGHRNRAIPMTEVRASHMAALRRLLTLAGVRRVYADSTFSLSLAQSLPLVRQPDAAAQGYAGAGTTVAVLDTGTDYTQAAFGACTAPGTPGCKVVYAQDFAADDGKRDDSSRHGTNVSGIIVGMAPGASIAALDVFGRLGLASTSVIIRAIDWAVQNKATYNIVAMNLSLGGSKKFTSICSGDVFATPVQNARNAGILPSIAAGNERYTNGLSSPACVPAATSVGAVYDAALSPQVYSKCSDLNPQADQVTCFSNSAPFLSLLAPGAIIDAAGVRMSGTSQAAPHVAGAAAVLAAAYPLEGPNGWQARLANTGTPVTDARNGLTKPRITLPTAVAP